MKIVAHSSLKIIFADHYKTQLVMEEAARNDSTFKWVSVRAGGLRHGPKQELKFYGNDGKGYPTIGKISRASVASFMIDCVESDQWDLPDAGHHKLSCNSSIDDTKVPITISSHSIQARKHLNSWSALMEGTRRNHGFLYAR